LSGVDDKVILLNTNKGNQMDKCSCDSGYMCRSCARDYN
jgi:hypothetical protein